MSVVLLKQLECNFNQKNQNTFPCEIWQDVSKIYTERQKTKDSQDIL